MLGTMILQRAKELPLNEFRRSILSAFCSHPSILENPQGAFVDACRSVGAIGGSPMVLGDRLSCEAVIREGLRERGVDDADLDFLHEEMYVRLGRESEDSTNVEDAVPTSDSEFDEMDREKVDG